MGTAAAPAATPVHALDEEDTEFQEGGSELARATLVVTSRR